MLEVRVRKVFPSFNLDVAFTLDGEILSVLGPSGCGKSMTLQCISGLLKPDEGRIVLNGRALFDSEKGINLPPQERRIGFVFQNYSLFPHLTVYQNIAFGIEHLGRAEVSERVTQLLDKMRLTGLAGRYPRQLSGGQQQRVALARALAPEPEVLLLDEPFSALDSLVKARLERELQVLHRYFKGDIIFVTHNLSEAYRFGSKIAVYDAGRILQLDHKERVINAPVSHTVARLTGARNFLPAMIMEIHADGALLMLTDIGQEACLKISGSFKTNSVKENVIAGIRPEDIRIAGEAGENRLPCRITELIEGVASYTCRLQVIDSPDKKYHLEAELSKAFFAPLEVGQECYAWLPDSRLFVISK